MKKAILVLLVMAVVITGIFAVLWKKGLVRHESEEAVLLSEDGSIRYTRWLFGKDEIKDHFHFSKPVCPDISGYRTIKSKKGGYKNRDIYCQYSSEENWRGGGGGGSTSPVVSPGYSGTSTSPSGPPTSNYGAGPTDGRTF